MPTGAKVTSLEALETFRAQLLVYVSKARPALEEVSADVLRLRLWLESTQRNHWENQLRIRKRQLEEAQAALFSARLSNLRTESAAEINAVHRARRALDEAERKLRLLKQWTRDFDSRVEPLVKQMEKMQTFLANDLIKAAAYLAEAVKTLDQYAGGGPVPSGGINPLPPRSTSGETPGATAEPSGAVQTSDAAAPPPSPPADRPDHSPHGESSTRAGLETRETADTEACATKNALR